MRKISSFRYLDMETQNIDTHRRVFDKILQLELQLMRNCKKGWSTEKVCINLTKEETDTLSETFENPKTISNRKYKLNNKTIKPPKQEDEVQCIEII